MIEIINHPRSLTAEEFRGLQHTDAYVRMLSHRLRICVSELMVDGVDHSDVYTENLCDEIEHLLQHVVTSNFHCARPEGFQGEFTVYFGSHVDLDLAEAAIRETTSNESSNQRRRQAAMSHFSQLERVSTKTL